MLRRGEFSIQIPQEVLYNLTWSGLLLLILGCMDCGQVFALSYVVNMESDTSSFYKNVEVIKTKTESSLWIQKEDAGYSREWIGWQLAPYPVQVEGGSYFGLIFDGETVFVSQVQPDKSFSPSSENFPIPESSTLFLMGIGLLAIGGLIRWEAAKKLKRALSTK